MTAIAAIAEKGRVWIGGDSAGSDSAFHLIVRKDEKVFINGPMLFGFTSSFRMGQLLRYSLQVPEQLNSLSDVEYMNTVFIDAMRDCFKEGGFMTNADEQEMGGTFIVGYKGGIYLIEDDLQVGLPVDNFASVGCGSQLCLGSLCTSKGAPKQRIIVALKAAERYNAGVRGPFIVKGL